MTHDGASQQCPTREGDTQPREDGPVHWRSDPPRTWRLSEPARNRPQKEEPGREVATGSVRPARLKEHAADQHGGHGLRSCPL
jgi:hypothetical protein